MLDASITARFTWMGLIMHLSGAIEAVGIEGLLGRLSSAGLAIANQVPVRLCGRVSLARPPPEERSTRFVERRHL